MKNITKIIIIFIIAIFYSGCGVSNNIPEITVNKDVVTKKQYIYFSVISFSKIDNIEDVKKLEKSQRNFAELTYKLKLIIKAMAEETIKTGNTHFIITEETIGQEDNSIPINTFLGIKEYCFNGKLSNWKIGTEKKCDNLKQEVSTTWTFRMLKDPDYRILAMDAKEVLKEIEAYKIDMKEVGLIKD